VDATHREWAAKTHGSTPGANVLMAASWSVSEAAIRTLIVQEATDWRDRHMQAQRNYRRGNLRLAIVAALIAVAGQAVVLFDDFGAGNHSPNSVSARMVTAEAVSRAGAIQIPSQPPARPPVSSTRLASTLLSDTSRG